MAELLACLRRPLRAKQFSSNMTVRRYPLLPRQIAMLAQSNCLHHTAFVLPGKGARYGHEQSACQIHFTTIAKA